MQENLSTENPLPKDPKFINHTGRRYGRLVATRYAGSLNRKSRWECLCDCGTTVTVIGSNLQRGTTTSCGCYKREATIKRETTHGHSGTSTYNSWCSMIQRCNDPLNAAYHHYGGRGITVCQGWMLVSNFIRDMGERPQGRSIDRIDNNKGYWCGKCEECVQFGRSLNCRWATQAEQMSNTRRTHLLTFQGQTMSVTQWAKEIGITRDALYSRLSKGWPIEKVLSRVPNKSAPSNPTP